MKKKSVIILALVAMMLFSLGQTVFAFQDVKNDVNGQKIEELKKLGILKGDPKDGKYNPKGKLTYAEGVTLIVKGLDLNLDHVRFIKEPKATDYFPNVRDDAWYSDAFIVAGFYGLGLPKTIKAGDIMSREQFGHSLFQAILTKGDYAFIELFIEIKDQDEVNSDYMDSIQKLLISKIAELDSTGKFYPKKAVTRSTAAGWVYNAIQFVKDTKPVTPQPEQPVFDLKLNVTPVNAEVNKVTVSAQVPHPGYGIRISSIGFEGNQAVIHVETVLPDPDLMYPQVITEVKATAYVDSAYKVALSSASGSSDASVGTGASAE